MNFYSDEYLYIAGPECFYPRGYDLWWSQRKLAEYHGVNVVIPTSTPIKCDNPDLNENAKEIFDDLIVQMNRATAIIADLEFFRGSEPDGGTVFEMGWLWSRKGRVYGYTRDSRSMAQKNQVATIMDGRIIAQDEKPLSYWNLPFCQSIVASTKIIEGDFKDALKLYLIDLDDARKHGILKKNFSAKRSGSPKRVYIASSLRYDDCYEDYCNSIKETYSAHGYEAVFPYSGNVPGICDPYRVSRLNFESNMRLLYSCFAIVADLNNYHGFEPNNDVSFECGVAFGAGLHCYGFMYDARIMRERIPHFSFEEKNSDWAGNTVEDFDLPINLMFGTYFEICQGSASSIIPLLKK